LLLDADEGSGEEAAASPGALADVAASHRRSLLGGPKPAVTRARAPGGSGSGDARGGGGGGTGGDGAYVLISQQRLLGGSSEYRRCARPGDHASDGPPVCCADFVCPDEERSKAEVNAKGVCLWGGALKRALKHPMESSTLVSFATTPKCHHLHHFTPSQITLSVSPVSGLRSFCATLSSPRTLLRRGNGKRATESVPRKTSRRRPSPTVASR